MDFAYSSRPASWVSIGDGKHDFVENDFWQWPVWVNWKINEFDGYFGKMETTISEMIDRFFQPKIQALQNCDDSAG